MEKKTLTRKDAHDVYVIVSSGKLTELKKTEEKLAVLNVLRCLRSVAMKYEDDVNEANEKLIPDGYQERRKLAALYDKERASGKQPTAMTDEDYRQFAAAHAEYNQTMAAALHDIDTATVELELDPVGVNLLVTLMTGNGWTVEQYFKVESVLCADYCQQKS